MPTKGQKTTRQEKQKKREKDKQKQTVVSFLILILFFYLEISLSAHAQTSETNILHLDQKAVKCITCKRCFVKFQLFIDQLN